MNSLKGETKQKQSLKRNTTGPKGQWLNNSRRNGKKKKKKKGIIEEQENPKKSYTKLKQFTACLSSKRKSMVVYEVRNGEILEDAV